MAPWSRADPAELMVLDLRAHSLLAGVPLHDVWRIDLPAPADGSDRTLAQLRGLLAMDRISSLNPVVRALFAFRAWLGRVFRLDEDDEGSQRDAGEIAPASFIHRLSDAERAASLEEPGKIERPFMLLYALENEALSEARNATVHAFSLCTLQRSAEGFVAYWAIYVKPVGRVTSFYMALIDPFRRFLVYPAILRNVYERWCEDVI